MSVIDWSILYLPDPGKGRPLFNAQIFVGKPDLDPEVAINQKQLNVIEENGAVVPVSQPFTVSAGGVPQYNGKAVRLDVDGNYSIKILNKLGAQVYYIENVFEGQPVTEASLPGLMDINLINDLSQAYTFKTVALMQASLIVFPIGKKITWQGYYAESDGGSNWGLVKAGAGIEDGGSEFDLADGKHVEANLKGKWTSIRKFGAVGDDTADDWDAMQTCIFFTKNTYVPNGHYKTTKTLRIPSDKGLKGTGKAPINFAFEADCLVHKVTNTLDSKGIDAVFACHDDVVHPEFGPKLLSNNTVFKDITLVGNNAGSTLTQSFGGAPNNNAYGLFIGAGESHTVSRVTVVNCIDALHMQQNWLSEVHQLIAYGRIYIGGGTSTHFTSCEGGFNTIEGYYITGAYHTLTCCGADGGGATRYVIEDCNGLVMNGCAMEKINPTLRDYDYTGQRGTYIQFKGINSVTINGFRAFSNVTEERAEQQAGAYLITAVDGGNITFNNDRIVRTLPASDGGDFGGKIFNIDNNARIDVNNGHSYSGQNWNAYNFFHSRTLGCILNIDKVFTDYTPRMFTGATATTTYAEQKGSYKIVDNYIEFWIRLYIRSKNGTGNVSIELPDANRITINNAYTVDIQAFNIAGESNLIGTVNTATNRLDLRHASDTSNVTDANIPADPFTQFEANFRIPINNI